jgi:DNA-binding NarL/FixJ family response regulator
MCRPVSLCITERRVSPVSVLLAVNDQLQQALILRALQRRDDLVVVGTEPDGRSALAEIVRLTPDVAIVDTGLPGLDGLELCRLLGPEVGTRVLLLAGDPPVSRDCAVAAGAAGCLPATGTSAQLGDAVTSIANGGTMFHI